MTSAITDGGTPPGRSRRLARIRWRARRGTRELDMLLARYLDARLEALDEAALALLEQLLDTPDPDLHDWLTGNAIPDEEALARLTDEIRAVVPPSHPRDP